MSVIDSACYYIFLGSSPSYPESVLCHVCVPRSTENCGWKNIEVSGPLGPWSVLRGPAGVTKTPAWGEIAPHWGQQLQAGGVKGHTHKIQH